MKPIDFPKLSPNSVSDNSISQLCGDRKTDAINLHSVFSAINYEVRGNRIFALSIQPPEVTVFFQSMLFVHILTAGKDFLQNHTGGFLHPKKHVVTCWLLLKRWGWLCLLPCALRALYVRSRSSCGHESRELCCADVFSDDKYEQLPWDRYSFLCVEKPTSNENTQHRETRSSWLK